MDGHPLPTLTLLASLVKAQRLADADEGWIRRMTTAVQNRMKTLGFDQLDVSVSYVFNEMGHGGLAYMAPGIHQYSHTFYYASLN